MILKTKHRVLNSLTSTPLATFVSTVLATTTLIAISATQARAADPVQLKNNREIYASYASIMNVDENDSDLREIYRLNVDRLPKHGTPDEFSNSVVLATTELGGAFCKKAITREKTHSPGQRILFGDVNFKRGPSQFNEYTTGAMLEHLAVAFWVRDITDGEKKALTNTLNSAIKGANDTPDETANALQILCTTYATSLAFIVK